MEFIGYQYANPQEIANLQDIDFARLVKNNKIYAINPQFVNSEPCMDRLIKHLVNLPIEKDTLKLVRDLVKYFQAPILYCLKEFYFKNKKHFEDMLEHQNQEPSTNSTRKVLKFLQQIGSMTIKFTSGMEQIEELNFLTKYGLDSKDITLQKKDQKHQQSYLIWLRKSLIGLQVMNSQIVSEKTRIEWIGRTQKEFAEMIGNRNSVWLEKFALNDIIMQSQNISNFQKQILNKQNKLHHSQLRNDCNSDNQNRYEPENKELIKNQYEDLTTILPSHRRFFFQNQKLSYAQDINLQYKNFKAPYDSYCIMQLRRAICAFLNRAGGVILVGVKEDINNKSRVVKGQILSEYKKQQVLREYKYICQQIQPDIISQGKYRIKFVPIKDRNNKYIQGKYIVRIEVAKGDERSFYTVNENGEEFVMLRTDNQVLRRRITQRTLANFKMRLLQPTKHLPLPSCPEPQIGIPLLEDKYVTKFNQKYEYCQDDDDKLDGCYRNSCYENKQKWKLKSVDPISPATKQTKPKDFIYMNVKKDQAEIVDQESNKLKNVSKKKDFICDEQERENDIEDNNNEKFKQSKMINSSKNQIVIQSEKIIIEAKKDEKDNKDEGNDELDFKPINPIAPKKYYPAKQSYQIERKKNVIKHLPKETAYKFESYQVDRSSENRLIETPSSIDLLVVGLTCIKVHQIAINVDLSLTKPPISCNDDLVIWICINSKEIKNLQKISQFMNLLNSQWKRIPNSQKKKKIKVRKLFSNVIFQDEILLNKFFNKFKHNEEFEDEKGIYYYMCKNKQQAIQAYMIGYEQNIKIKFISNEQLKEKKLAYLKSKVEKRQSERIIKDSLQSFYLN